MNEKKLAFGCTYLVYNLTRAPYWPHLVDCGLPAVLSFKTKTSTEYRCAMHKSVDCK